VNARRLRARRLAALDEFAVENGERALRAVGGRREAERFLAAQDVALDVPQLVDALAARAAE
jgi:LAO/AO transport system kinase